MADPNQSDGADSVRPDTRATTTSTPPRGQPAPRRFEDDVRDDDGASSIEDHGHRRDDHDEQTSVLRVPTFSPLAPLLGWLVAWGAIATATAILQRVDVPTGFNLGIADGGPGDSGFWAGVWALVVSGGAFVLGGYTASRLARANGTRHAVLAWVVAMGATAADGIIAAMSDGTDGIINRIIGVPFWGDTGLTGEGEAILVLALFAGVSLVGAIIGGGLGQTANRIDRTDDAVVTTS